LENLRQKAEKVVVPVAPAGGDGAVVILEKSPDLAKRREVLDLNRCQCGERDPGPAIELVVGLEDCLGAFELGSVGDGFAVSEKTQVIGPSLSGTTKQEAEVESAAIGMDGNGNCVFLPIGCTVDIEFLRAVKRERARPAVQTYPDRGEAGYVRGSDEAAELNAGAAEIDRQSETDSGKVRSTIGLPFDADRSMAAMEDPIIGRDVIGGRGGPSGRAAVLNALESEQFGNVRSGDLLRGQEQSGGSDRGEQAHHDEDHICWRTR